MRAGDSADLRPYGAQGGRARREGLEYSCLEVGPFNLEYMAHGGAVQKTLDTMSLEE